MDVEEDVRSEEEYESEGSLSMEDDEDEEDYPEISQQQMIEQSNLDKKRKKHLLDLVGKKYINSDLLYELLNTEDDSIFTTKVLEEISNTSDILQALYHIPEYKKEIRKIYEDNTKDIRIVLIGNRKYKCPKCKSADTNTVAVQNRSGDEGATDFNTCLSCGYKWTKGS